jgi:hypothetical protein
MVEEDIARFPPTRFLVVEPTILPNGGRCQCRSRKVVPPPTKAPPVSPEWMQSRHELPGKAADLFAHAL